MGKFSDGGAGCGTANITLGAGDVVLAETRGIYVGGGGTLDVGFADGANAQFVDVLAGSFIPLRVTTIFDATTTATNLVALR